MGNWNYNNTNLNTGYYDVARNDGTYEGSINITVDGNGNLNTTASWVTSGNTATPVTLSWNPTGGAGTLSFSAWGTTYNLKCTSAGTPTTFESSDNSKLYEMRFNQNSALSVPWPTSNPAHYVVSVNNNSSHNGTLGLSKDGGGNVSCLGAWSPSGNPNANTQRVRITWDGTKLGWNVEWGSGAGAPKDSFSNGQYNSGTNQFSGQCNVVSAAATPGTWQATQTNPVPMNVEEKHRGAHKKAV